MNPKAVVILAAIPLLAALPARPPAQAQTASQAGQPPAVGSDKDLKGTDSGSPRVGGGCAYDTTLGTATIVRIENPPAGEYQAPHAVKVVFKFAPLDSSASGRYAQREYPDTGQVLTVGAGMHPPRRWVKEQGLTVGSRHPCMRLDLVRGTCTPVCFRFLDVDYDSWTGGTYLRRKM